MANTIIPTQRSINPSQYSFSAGTYTFNIVGTRPRQTKTAGADGQTFITIPLTIDRPYNQYGFRLKEIYIPYNMDVAAPTVGFQTLIVNRHDLDNPTTGAGSSVAQTSFASQFNLAFQQGQNTVTNTNISSTSQAMVITPNAQFFENENGALNRTEWAIQVNYTPAATTTFILWSAIIRYETTIG